MVPIADRLLKHCVHLSDQLIESALVDEVMLIGTDEVPALVAAHVERDVALTSASASAHTPSQSHRKPGLAPSASAPHSISKSRAQVQGAFCACLSWCPAFLGKPPSQNLARFVDGFGCIEFKRTSFG